MLIHKIRLGRSVDIMALNSKLKRFQITVGKVFRVQWRHSIDVNYLCMLINSSNVMHVKLLFYSLKNIIALRYTRL